MRRPGRATLVAVVALTVLAGLAVASVPPRSGPDDPSSRASGRMGTLALYSWLGDLGFAVHRLESELDLGDTDVLLSVDPTGSFSQADTDGVMAHLRSGGDAVIAVAGVAGLPAVAALLERLGVEPGEEAIGGSSAPAEPFDPGNRVGRVPVGAAVGWHGPPEVVPLLVAGGMPVAVAVRVPGGGRAYVVGSSQPFSNDGLRHGDAAPFVLSLLGRARGGRIDFDEVHHGAAASSSGAASLLEGPLGLAVLLAGAVVVAWRGLAGRRLGRPMPVSDPGAVPTATSYVEAMAQLFERSRRRGGVAADYARELKVRVGAVAGVDPHLGDVAFMRALTGHAAGRVEAVGTTLERARLLAAGQPSEREVVALARDVDAVETAWSQP